MDVNGTTIGRRGFLGVTATTAAALALPRPTAAEPVLSPASHGWVRVRGPFARGVYWFARVGTRVAVV